MCQLNNQYKAKFGFPFVICARLNKIEAILQGLQTRLNHTSVEAEVQIGIEQVLKISELRLKDIVHWLLLFLYCTIRMTHFDIVCALRSAQLFCSLQAVCFDAAIGSSADELSPKSNPAQGKSKCIAWKPKLSTDKKPSCLWTCQTSSIPNWRI